VRAVFGPGTQVVEIAKNLLEVAAGVQESAG
jgi:hypothetical protein